VHRVSQTIFSTAVHPPRSAVRADSPGSAGRSSLVPPRPAASRARRGSSTSLRPSGCAPSP